MLVRATIPEAQPPSLAAKAKPQQAPDATSSQWAKILLETLNDPADRYARTEKPVPVGQVEDLRIQLRDTSTALTRARPDLHAPDEMLKVSIRVTTDSEPYDLLAAGVARGTRKWMEKLDRLPKSTKVHVWFRMHRPQQLGPRARRADELPGDALLLCTGGDLHIGEAPASAFADGLRHASASVVAS